MKRALAFLLLSLYLNSFAEVRELYKIHSLSEHYSETVRQDHSVSFFNFMVMHYITDDHNTRDNDRDAQLPFKSPGPVLSHGFSPVVPAELTDIHVQSFAVAKEMLPEAAQLFHPVMNCSSIWRPPQLMC